MIDKDPDPIDVYVGSRMQLRRTLMGLTQEQLAKAIVVYLQQVNKYDPGQKPLRP